MSTQQKMEPGLLEKLGDGFNGFMEGSFGFITRLFGSANERTVKSTGYHRPKNSDKHTIIPGSVLDKVTGQGVAQQMRPGARYVDLATFQGLPDNPTDGLGAHGTSPGS